MEKIHKIGRRKKSVARVYLSRWKRKHNDKWKIFFKIIFVQIYLDIKFNKLKIFLVKKINMISRLM